ncbi:nitrous oxide reductase accessory protein NosL [uncultured Tenacibaculum sp.]|uniref:nitrous oxide reductase accessory protein NosL n=1 Tax=uncultured Tenacibaculum sp. TaxID=174713 RepID=UPI002618E617|nr:nitrous oxide reductase accessory protein NosL [uncultured Tenacibaculum sp.]
MNYAKPFILLLTIILLSGCAIEPQKIEYGKDACSFCKMTIVEKKFAAQIVTKKGRASKYDAIECMLNDIKDKKETSLAHILVTDYTRPEKLINATNAVYLISKQIKSPMGAYLSAYASDNEAETNQGDLFNWKAIKKRFN